MIKSWVDFKKWYKLFERLEKESGVPVNRGNYIWIQLWLSQKKRCAECHKPLLLQESIKRAMSFEIICRECYKRPQVAAVITDEVAND